jgi:hypothetical protein
VVGGGSAKAPDGRTHRRDDPAALVVVAAGGIVPHAAASCSRADRLSGVPQSTLLGRQPSARSSSAVVRGAGSDALGVADAMLVGTAPRSFHALPDIFKHGGL